MGPAAQRMTKENKQNCEQEAILRWNKRIDYSHKITLESPDQCSTKNSVYSRKNCVTVEQ